MYTPEDTALKQLLLKLSPEAWDERVAQAQAKENSFRRVHELIGEGHSARHAIREIFPDEPIESRYTQYLRYRDHGLEGLIDHRFVARQRSLTPEMGIFVQGLVFGNPGLRSPQLCKAVEKKYGQKVGESTMREFLRGEGLAAPVGKPAQSKQREQIVPLPYAGAELLKAVEQEIGAIKSLAGGIEKALASLPPPTGEVRDDRHDRDEHGHFLPSYNVPEPRRNPELGAKFESVESHREGKDLPAMRTANTGTEVLFRKATAMTLLPLLVPDVRWDGLATWKGDYLGELCGFPYQPATLDKFLRELKYAGVAEVARENVASFWLTQEGSVVDPATGAVVLYADISTKPHWTHHFSKATAISKLGKVMPGASTVSLHSGYGTPLIYHTVYGGASLPKEMDALLQAYERAAGEGTAKRLVVMDREAHAAWLFKDLDPKWLYIVPLRGPSTGNKARFEEQGPWGPYGDGDEVCTAMLWLNDSKDRKNPIRVRVVGRRRHRTGKVFWLATNAPASDFPASSIVDIYFKRWPLQELVFRDANAAVHLDTMYGFGKKKVENVAVIDSIEKLGGQIRNAQQKREETEVQRQEASVELKAMDARIAAFEKHIPRHRDRVAKAMAAETVPSPQEREDFKALTACEDRLAASHLAADEVRNRLADTKAAVAKLDETIAKKQMERTVLQSRTDVFTVDMELDETLLAFKLTFLNLCFYLLRTYFPGIDIETTTLIDHILTLPGERVLTRTTETIRIYRQPRERRFMGAVKEACRLLTAKRLKSGKRTLCFEVYDTVV